MGLQPPPKMASSSSKMVARGSSLSFVPGSAVQVMRPGGAAQAIRPGSYTNNEVRRTQSSTVTLLGWLKKAGSLLTWHCSEAAPAEPWLPWLLETISQVQIPAQCYHEGCLEVGVKPVPCHSWPWWQRKLPGGSAPPGWAGAMWSAPWRGYVVLLFIFQVKR